MIPVVWFFRVLVLTGRIIVSPGLMIAVGITVGLSGIQCHAKIPQDVLIMATQIDDMITLDPAEIFEFSAAEYAANVYDRLVTFEPDDFSTVAGGVAESWVISRNGKEFRFRIRPGLKFHSGNPVTAQDAAYSLQRVVILNLSPAFILTQFGLNGANVHERVRAESEDILVIETDKSYAPTFVLNCLSAGVGSVVDQSVVQSYEVDGDMGHRWLRTNSAGSGPFMLSRWKANESIVLKRHTEYWRMVPAMNRVILRHIGEPATQRLLLQKADVDIARDLGPDQIAGLASVPNVVVRPVPKSGIYYLGLNQRSDILRRPRVVEALKHLVDYQGLRDSLLANRASIHQSIVPKGFVGAIQDQPYVLDVEKARTLLAHAGYGNGFRLNIDTRNTSPAMEIAQSLQATFALAGIELNIVPGDGKQVLTKYRARNHEIFLGRWGTDYQDPHSNASAFAYNPDNSEGSVTKSLAWRNGWRHPELSEMVGRAVREKDGARRAALYREMQSIHMRVSPFVIMFQDIEIVALRKSVHGFISGPTFDTVFYRNVTKD